MEKLLAKKMRERFIAVCIGPDGEALGHAQPFRDFSVKLGGLRWQVVTQFCIAVA